MTYQFKFQKVLTIKEQEKEEAKLKFEQSLNTFENEATKLYHLLKKKEELEEIQRNELQTGISVQMIRHHQYFLANLMKQIQLQQEKVMKARMKMQYEEQKLLDKNIEVKKFEKMKEKDFANFNYEMDKLESKWLDELTMLQLANRGN